MRFFIRRLAAARPARPSRLGQRVPVSAPAPPPLGPCPVGHTRNPQPPYECVRRGQRTVTVPSGGYGVAVAEPPATSYYGEPPPAPPPPAPPPPPFRPPTPTDSSPFSRGFMTATAGFEQAVTPRPPQPPLPPGERIPIEDPFRMPVPTQPSVPSQGRTECPPRPVLGR